MREQPVRGRSNPMFAPSPVLSRRGLLRAAGLLGAGAFASGLAGCDLFGDDTPTPEQQPPAIVTMLGSTAALAELYDAAILAVPELATVITPVRDTHRAHTKALAQTLGAETPKPAANKPTVPSDRERAIAALIAAEKEARDDAVAECLAAPARFAPLLGSIAAARASHLEVLV